ncbi:TadE/TadG family type IV pilus assembly protein [Sphingomonas sp. TREG-RG-20F-R18-01]|uniref:TadE/TadG family type IV pilus assembly protein n=1 Tax=Sphingomonas sp. TREG-RG-20F-R18-01 TaxID=2914982 RepID=UPI001F59CA0D|nr:TadE/TadG family type IV pilus assembly protein [Sphingomonas sp. TREG-RG-20F-R18-01]
MMRRPIASDVRGAALVEFAFVAPVMLLLMMGLCDLIYQVYAKSVLNGAVQKAGRDATIQGGAQQTDTLDARVLTGMSGLFSLPTNSCATTPVAGSWCSSRKSYATFSTIGAEPFTDSNNDGIRQVGECYSDINGNKQWDADAGIAGQGGANDVTLYTMSVTYPRIFPIAGLIGWPTTVTITTTTLLKNQPYATQAASSPATICT